MAWLIGVGYTYWLDGLGLLLLSFTLWGSWRFWQRQSQRGRLALITLGLMFLAAGLAWERAERPSVYYDEFFYAATAANIARHGAVEPLYYRGLPTQEWRYGYPRPPYPVAWPHLVSCDLRLRALLAPASLESWPIWRSSVEVNRLVHVVAVALLFWALSSQFGLLPATVTAALMMLIPAIQRLTQGGSAEGATFSAIVLTYWAYTEWKQKASMAGALWVVLSAVWLAHLRPEALLWSLLAVAGLFYDCYRSVPELFRKVVWVGGLVFCLGVAPGLAIMGYHPAEADHHFQAIPRAQMDMMTNRAHNLINNARALVDNKIWPLPLTLLAALGVGLGSGRERWLWLSVAGALTLWLSWFPFGDYDCVYSLDSWRFTYHLFLPALVLSAFALRSLVNKPAKPILIACLLLLASMLYMGIAPKAFFCREHPLERVWNMAASPTLARGESVVVAESEEYHNVLRYGMGLPTVLGCPTTCPEAGLAVFRVADDLDTVPSEWRAYHWELIDADRQTQPEIGIYLLMRKWDGEAERGHE